MTIETLFKGKVCVFMYYIRYKYRKKSSCKYNLTGCSTCLES